jgi:pimeloyl-ACP methyl ester carboxylesterase
VTRIEARYPPRGRFVPVTGGRLHVLDRPAAQGEPFGTIVLVHGASGNLADIDLALGARLASRHRVLVIDRPGHGWSDRPGGRADASPARQAQLVREALDALGVERAVIVGHSWSGALATNLALDHSEKVSALLLLSPVTHPWPGGVSWQNPAAASRFLGEFLVRTVVLPLGTLTMKPIVRGIFSPQSPPPGYVENADIPLILRPGQFRANAQDINELNPFMARQAPRYPAITVPTTIITGDQDHIVTPEIHSHAISRQIAGARLVVIHGAGHMPHHTATDRVLEEIEDLAEQVAPRQFALH